MFVVAQTHDGFCRLLTESTRRLGIIVRERLPAPWTERLADAPVRIVDGNFVSRGLRASRSDRLCEVALEGDGPRSLVLLIEHKSANDPGTPLQIMGYLHDIWSRHAAQEGNSPRSLPPVVPIVIYHGREPWTVPLSVSEAVEMPPGMEPGEPWLVYVLFNLADIAYEDLSEDAEVRAGCGLLKYAFETAPPAHLQRIVDELGTLTEPGFYYMVANYELALEELERLFRNAAPGLKDRMMATAAETWMKQGKAEGRAEGKAEGRAEGRAEGKAEGRAEGEARGKAEMLLRLMERRFGAVPEAVRAQVSAAPMADLDGWIDAILDARDVDEVFVNGSAHQA